MTLEEAKERAQGLRGRASSASRSTSRARSITAYAGPPPETEHTDYCWGGCPGAIEEAIEILRAYDKECDKKMPRLHVVFGAYEGPIDAKPGEKVVFIGDCAKWEGKIGDKLVQDREPLQGPLHEGPAQRQARRHLRQDGERDAEAPRRAQGRRSCASRAAR